MFADPPLIFRLAITVHALLLVGDLDRFTLPLGCETLVSWTRILTLH
jgi:hypothetical protein